MYSSLMSIPSLIGYDRPMPAISSITLYVADLHDDGPEEATLLSIIGGNVNV